MDSFSLKDLGDVYVDYLLRQVSKGMTEVRKTAIESIIIFLKKNYYLSKSNEIIKKFTTEFAAGTTFRSRLVFLEFYEQCSEHFSKNFFKMHNLNDAVLNLALDSVYDVKKKFLESVVSIRKMLDDGDKALLSRFDQVISKNVADKNKSISQVRLIINGQKSDNVLDCIEGCRADKMPYLTLL